MSSDRAARFYMPTSEYERDPAVIEAMPRFNEIVLAKRFEHRIFKLTAHSARLTVVLRLPSASKYSARAFLAGAELTLSHAKLGKKDGIIFCFTPSMQDSVKYPLVQFVEIAATKARNILSYNGYKFDTFLADNWQIAEDQEQVQPPSTSVQFSADDVEGAYKHLFGEF